MFESHVNTNKKGTANESTSVSWLSPDSSELGIWAKRPQWQKWGSVIRFPPTKANEATFVPEHPAYQWWKVTARPSQTWFLKGLNWPHGGNSTTWGSSQPGRVSASSLKRHRPIPGMGLLFFLQVPSQHHCPNALKCLTQQAWISQCRIHPQKPIHSKEGARMGPWPWNPLVKSHTIPCKTRWAHQMLEQPAKGTDRWSQPRSSILKAWSAILRIQYIQLETIK